MLFNGNGTDLTNTKALRGKAKRKTITQKMVLGLVDVSKNKMQHDRTKGYWNTYHCQNKVHTSNGKLYGTYCKNRFCTTCCANRKADIMNRYLPAIMQWEEPYFVTLTVKAIPARNLRKWLKDGMIRGFHQIIEKHKKRHQRGTGIKIMGIKSLECNFNPLKKTYNPHFHIVVPDKETAQILIEEWLIKWKAKDANRAAQHMTKINDKEKVLIEIVKYGSKIFTEVDVNNKSHKKDVRNLHVAALNNIFGAMHGLRIFERFGFNLPRTSKEVNQQVTTEYDKWLFNSNVSDWTNTETGEMLTGYTPTHQLTELLDNRIDKELE